MKKDIEKFALYNAVKFEGKANPGSVIGAMFKENPDLKKKAKELSATVREIVNNVNNMSVEEQKEKLMKIAPEMLEEKKVEKKRELPELRNVKGKVVTRIPPEPSKYPHIGHAVSFLINYMYAQKYGGDCVLRLDDTNPEKVKKEYYDAVHEGLLWLNIAPKKIMIASNEMETFYKYAKKLIEEENAFVCFCDREKMSEHRTNSKICDHREQNVRVNLEEWENLLNGKYKVGEATLRLRGDMDSMNAVMRDPVIFRISDKNHCLQGDKYKIWPMYDFESAVAEELTGVTHIFRSSEFGKMRIELQDYIKNLLGFKLQEVVQYGRMSIVGFPTQGRVIREMIEKKEVDGWDDPRLITLKSLMRRGIRPETLYELTLEVGLSTNATNIDWSVVASINRKLIDNETKRFFFVKDPEIVKVEHELKQVDVPNHPSNKEFGERRLKVNDEFYVQDPIDPNKTYRFMHIFNFKDGKFISQDYSADLKAKIIHAVPVEDAIDVEVLMADGTKVVGKGEKALKNLKEGEVVQFERLFFCRLDDKEKMLFVYTHD
ncbi:glutamate--tRNA ligase [archaeon]|jgi:glutamyl-tRNA synthetase|nr:glutamate--tRNA ligase [archaeon]MBT3731304.1 glutamate--tRNA ligase [archaeon]MBT4669957.1 glutamate--tRNA ligase [archaeon]MBT5029782.1 glutamate--tRNA ligase [archaeon]MBT5287469.1 glutamate--tRNA ligase [archaeon]